MIEMNTRIWIHPENPVIGNRGATITGISFNGPDCIVYIATLDNPLDDGTSTVIVHRSMFIIQ